MHKYRFESGGNFSKRSRISKREISLEKPRLKRDASSSSLISQKHHSTSAPSSAGTSGILTSNDECGKSTEAALPASRFYGDAFAKNGTPKSSFEKRYEERLSRFLPSVSQLSSRKGSPDPTSEFQPLELESEVAESTKNAPQSEIPEISPTSPPETTDSARPTSISEGILRLPIGNIIILSRAAETFLDEAHRNVLGGNDVGGTKQYYFLVQQALRCIHAALDFYLEAMDPQQMAWLHFKLAVVYFTETENVEIADLYAGKAIRGAISQGNVVMRAKCDVLLCEIAERTSAASVDLLLVEKAAVYRAEKMANMAAVFQFMRSAASGSAACLAALDLSELDLELQAILSFQMANVSLGEGNKTACAEHLKNGARKVSLLREKQLLPPQLCAMNHLLHLALYIVGEDYRSARKCLHAVTGFVEEQKAEEWTLWRQDGTFDICISIGPEKCLAFSVLWLDPKEIHVVIGLYAGLLYLLDRNNMNKAESALDTAYSASEDAIQRMTTSAQMASGFPMARLTGKIVRFTYLKVLTLYHQVWYQFMVHNDYKGVHFLQAFISCFEDDNFTKEELCYYRPLLPRFYFLTALYYQIHGDLNAAKTFHGKVRETLLQRSDNSDVSLMQRKIGVAVESAVAFGTASELFMFSTLHLVCIVEFELKEQVQGEKNGISTQQCRMLLARYYSEISGGLEGSSGTSSATFLLTYKCICAVFHTHGLIEKPGDSELAELTEISRLLDDKTMPASLSLFALFVLLKLSLNVDQAARYYGKCTRRITKDDDIGRMFSAVVLQEAAIREQNEHNVEKIKRKLHSLLLSIQGKFEMARFSLAQESLCKQSDQ